MIITCNECQTRFTLDEKLIRDEGTKVQCSNCNHLFTAHPPSSDISTIKLTDVLQSEGPTQTGSDTELKEDTVSIDDLQIDPDRPEGIKSPGKPEDVDLSSVIDADDDLSLELEDDGFDFDFDAKNVQEPGVKTVEDELDLDFELDSEYESDPLSDLSVEDDDFGEIQDLDLTDLEELVELDQDSEAGSEAEEAVDDTAGPMDIKLDSEEAPAAEESEDDLVFDFEPESGEDGEMVLEVEPDEDANRDDGAFEMSLEEPDAGEETEELDVGFDDDGAEPGAAADDDDRQQQEEVITPLVEVDSALEPEFEDEPPAVTPPPLESSAEERGAGLDDTLKPAQRKRVSAPLLVLLIIMLLGGAGYGSFLLMDRMGIEVPYLDKITPYIDKITPYMDKVTPYIDKIPYIGQSRQPQVEDPGNLKMTPIEIQSRFVSNQQAGKLFVIQGQVRNDYPEPRSFVSVNGKLYAKGKKQVSSKTVYCGNTLTTKEIAKMGMVEVDKQLSNRSGAGGINTQIKPGQPVPFVIVFDKLPDSLDEFTVTVVNSSPSK